MSTILLAVLGGVLWRLRGIMGWPFTVLFAALAGAMVYPISATGAVVFGLWIVVGELSGWKPKLIWDKGDWWASAFHGLLIGGVGAVSVPLSTWLQLRFGEPQISWLQNPREFKLPFWSHTKRLLDWRGAWNEVYNGALFIVIVSVIKNN